MSGSFRLATASDADAVIALMRDYYVGEGYPFSGPAARDALVRLLANPALGRVWMIVEDRDPVGYLVLTLGYSLEYFGRDAFIDELFVRPDARRRGIGTSAIETAVRTCRELGVRALHLEVERANSTAQALYRRAGFVDGDRRLLTRRLDREGMG